MADIVIFDTEYTAWEGSQERDWSYAWEHREIVQIGAIKTSMDSFGKVLDEFCVFVRPQINPEPSDYFTELTGITNEMIENQGIDFSSAAELFHSFCAGSKYYSFGTDDLVLNENIHLYGLEDKVKQFKGVDLRPWFEQYGIDLSMKVEGELLCSGLLAKAVGVSFDSRTQPHNALYDVHSIHLAMKHLIHEKGEMLHPG